MYAPSRVLVHCSASMAGSAWVPVWVAFAILAHAFAALVLARSALWRQVLVANQAVRRRVSKLLRRSGSEQDARRRTQSYLAATGGFHSPASSTISDHVDTLATRPLRRDQPQVALLAWQDVGCIYPGTGGKPKTVLQGALGVVCAGQLTALLGPSGSGKSTLLEILAGHKSMGWLTGRIAVTRTHQPLQATRKQQQDAHMYSPAGCGDAEAHNVSSAPTTDTSPVTVTIPECIDPDSGGRGQQTHQGNQAGEAGGTQITGYGVRSQSTGTERSPVPVHSSTNSSGSQRAAAAHDEVIDTSLLVWRDIKAHSVAMKQFGAFVPQDSAFPPSLTTEEVMQVHASLLGLHASRGICDGSAAADRQQAVRRALEDVGLTQQSQTLVGGPLPGGLLLRGLSGGERKRLAVACGLLGTPLLLLLDEPTTGLDATTAASLMSRLSGLCSKQGISVLCSLHQPRAAIWTMLDVVVVVSGGYTIYSGPRQRLVPWLTGQLEYAYHPGQHGSPPDWVLDLVNINFAKPKKYFSNTMCEKEHLAAAAAAFSADWADRHADLEKAAYAQSSTSAGRQLTDGAQTGASWWQQVKVLTWREASLVIRNPADMAGRALVFCWAGLVTGAVFYALPLDVQGMVFRNILMVAEVFVVYLLPFVYMSLYTADRRIFIAELSAKLYPPSAYYTAKAVVLTVFSALNSCIFSAVAYGMSGLVPEGGPLLAHMLVATLSYLTAQQVLYCSAIISPNQDIAFMMGIVWTAVNLLLSNNPIRLVDYTMTWVRPLRFISAMYYAFSGLLTIEFRGTPAFTCADGLGDWIVTKLPDYIPTVQELRLPTIQKILRNPGADCTLSPEGMLEFFSLSWPWWPFMLLLAGYLLLLHAASLAALVLVSRKERR